MGKLASILRNLNSLKNQINKSIKREFLYPQQNNLFDKTNLFGDRTRMENTIWGKYSTCNYNCIINSTIIGNYTSIAANVLVAPRNHIFQNFITSDCIYTKNEHEFRGGYYKYQIEAEEGYQCKIGNDVWIGQNVIVLSGVEIGDGAVVGTGSVVTKSVPPYAIVGGNPAKFIRWRFKKDQIDKLISIKWFNWNLNEIIERRNELEQIVKFDMSDIYEDYSYPHKRMMEAALDEVK